MKVGFWLACGTFVIAVGQACNSPSVIFAGIGLAMFAWVEHKPRILCMLKDGRTLMDNGDNAFTLSVFGGRWSVLHFSPSFIARHGSTWAVAAKPPQGRQVVWFYTPKGTTHDEA